MQNENNGFYKWKCNLRQTGSIFLIETIYIKRPDGRIVTLEYNSGMLNRLDRLTSANYGKKCNE